MKDKNNHINYLLDNVLNYVDFYDSFSKNNEIVINGKKYSLDQILSKTYIHPLDSMKIQNVNSVHNKDIYKQFMINLFMHYNNPAMNFTHNLQSMINNKTNILPDEISFFNYNTANFLRFRFVYDEYSSALRGGILIDKTENGFLSYKEEISEYIVSKMEKYINIMDEDKYDFYVPYHAFIEYFLKNDKLSFDDIIDQKSKEDGMYESDMKYIEKLNETSIKNDETNNIVKNVKYYLKFFDTVLHKDILAFYEFLPLNQIIKYVDKNVNIKLILDILVIKAKNILNENNNNKLIIEYLKYKKHSLRVDENEKYYDNNNESLTTFVIDKLLDLERRLLNIMDFYLELENDQNKNKIFTNFNTLYQSNIINVIRNKIELVINYIKQYLMIYEFNLSSEKVKEFIKNYNTLCNGLLNVLTLDDILYEGITINDFFINNDINNNTVFKNYLNENNIIEIIKIFYNIVKSLNININIIVDLIEKFINNISISDININKTNIDNMDIYNTIENDKTEKNYAINIVILAIYVNIFENNITIDDLIRYVNYKPTDLFNELFSEFGKLNENTNMDMINYLKNANLLNDYDQNKQIKSDKKLLELLKTNIVIDDSNEINKKYTEELISKNVLFYDCLSQNISSLFMISPYIEHKKEFYNYLMYSILKKVIDGSGNIIILNAHELKNNIINKIPLILNPVINIKDEVKILHETIFPNDNKFKKLSVNNFKSFVSMLPLYYFKYIYNNHNNNTVSISNNNQTQSVTENTISLEINNPTENLFFNPINIQDTNTNLIIIKQENEQNIISNNNEVDDIIYSNFWFGIPYNDFNRLSLLQKSIILRSCFTMAKCDFNNGKIIVTYENAINEGLTIEYILIIPYPYSASETMHNIVTKVVKNLNINDSLNFRYDRQKYLSNIALNDLGNNIFIKKVSEISSLKDLITTYIMLRDSNPGEDSIKLSPDQEASFIVNIMRLLNYNVSVITSKRNDANVIYIRVKKDRITVENFKRTLKNQYNISNPKILTAISNKMAPLFSYINRKNLKDIESAGDGQNDFIYPIIEYKNPINILNNVDLSFINTNSLFELLNTDIFEPENTIFKNSVIAAMNNDSDNIVDVIVENLPQSTSLKKSICSNIYEYVAGLDNIMNGNSLNDVLQSINESECEDRPQTIENDTLLKKIINKNKMIANVDVDITANIFKNNLLKIMETITSRYACQLRAPIHYINTLDKLKNILSNDNINLNEDFKTEITTTIRDIYENTLKIIKYIIIINTILELSRAYKRVNKDISNTIIDSDLITKVTCAFKDVFMKYFKNLENIKNNPVFSSLLNNTENNNNNFGLLSGEY